MLTEKEAARIALKTHKNSIKPKIIIEWDKIESNIIDAAKKGEFNIHLNYIYIENYNRFKSLGYFITYHCKAITEKDSFFDVKIYWGLEKKLAIEKSKKKCDSTWNKLLKKYYNK